MYQYDLSDFKKFLNDTNKSNRVDGLIFWQNRIPLPIDLFNRMFAEADSLLETYVDHLIGALLALKHFSDVAGTRLSFTDLPSKDLMPRKHGMADVISRLLATNSGYRQAALRIAGALGLDDYVPAGQRIADALCHQGKKYARLQIPLALRHEFGVFEAEVASNIGFDNTDMFGNVVADRYDIYRSGFGDALANIFNQLLEFRLLCGGRVSSSRHISIDTAGNSDKFHVLLERTRDGSLWEPHFSDDLGLRINPEHPFCKAMGDRIGEVKYLLYSLAEFEYNQFSDVQKKLIENMRQEVSRDLWIRFDK